MASEKDAQKAADAASSQLMALGAHAIDVRKNTSDPGYAVLAYFEKQPNPAPPLTLSIGRGRTKRTVPLRVVIAQPFAPE